MASKTASKTTAPTPLPTQKRKASNASSTVSEGSRTGNGSSNHAQADAKAEDLKRPKLAPQAIAAATASNLSVRPRDRANSKDSSAICESRLPRKKRRESHDERSTTTASRTAINPGGEGPQSPNAMSTGRIRFGLGGSLGSLEEGRIRTESSLDDASSTLGALHSKFPLLGCHLPPLDELHSLNDALASTSEALLTPHSETATTTLMNRVAQQLESNDVASMSTARLPPIASSLDQLDPLLNVDDPLDATKSLATSSVPPTDHDAIPKSIEPIIVVRPGAGGGDEDEVSLTSSGHGLLLDAMGLSVSAASESAVTKDGVGSSNEPGAMQLQFQLPSTASVAAATLPDDTNLPVKRRDRQDSVTTAQSQDRWDTFAATVAAAHSRERGESIGARFEATFNLSGAGGGVGRERCDSWMGRRDRLESWGGMSDLSVPVAGSTAPPSSILLDDHQQHAAQQLHSGNSASLDSKAGAIPTRISLQRDRLNSIASLGDLSLSAFAGNVDGMEVASDIQAFVAAAMATVGDQLMELAGEMEEVAGETLNFEDFKREMGFDSECGESASVASPLIGAVSDAAAHGQPRGRARTWSTSSGRISVDLDAVRAAMDAAEAASGSLGLAQSPQSSLPIENPSQSQKRRSRSKPLPTSSGDVETRGPRRNMVLKRKNADSNASASTASDDALRHDTKESGMSNARGSRTKKTSTNQAKNLPPLKKRGRRASPDAPATITSSSIQKTPKVSNRTTIDRSDETMDIPPMVVSSSSITGNEEKQAKQSGQASQKWEAMYECLLEFAVERRTEETKDMSEEEKQAWIWDGNVPTTYKTKDGKALGRWVNNQRSAKSKGNLKDDREERLVEAGLKWSVMAADCWNEMLEELSVYIKDQHRQGKTWDGNVPTNYQIKSRPDGGFNGEDKNLGRWINRQRSMFQAGRLRKDRQLALEAIGLKWSMLATTSWDSMFDTLKEYIDETKKLGPATWDGNVPANHRTNHTPPRSLGRWVNRQRSAYAKNKLKKECADKLSALGLKWSVHSRIDDIDDGDDGEFMDEMVPSQDIVGSSDLKSEKESAEPKPAADTSLSIHAV